MNLSKKFLFLNVILGACFVNLSIASESLQVSSSIEATLNEVEVNQEQWFQYQVVMEPNNGSPCCYHSKNQKYCALSGENKGRGSLYSSDSIDSDLLNIYFQLDVDEVTAMIVAGGACPVNVEGTSVTELLNVSNQQSVAFLSAQLEKVTIPNITDKIISSIAMHKGVDAQRTIENLLSVSKHREKAIFWLGAARNEAGYEVLASLLDDEKVGLKTKKQVIFALSQNSSKNAFPRLMRLAKQSSDPVIKGESLFWLAQNNVEAAFPVIESILKGSPSRRLTDKAVFALSQYSGERSWSKLVDLARNHSDSHVREKAIFWLSQKSVPGEKFDALPILLKLANSNEARKIKEQAVFGISQLKDERAVEGLVSLINGSRDKRVKQRANFWLGQSEHPKALEYIDTMLVSAKNE
ncbi:HEAT repeat domain-containing protein [Aliikangiella marina]|uniref:HEAT repeat domain-containing protein n=1 Tax=Aliikangiella marina TaxID=1712262 RepID=A0A545T2W2_9GAMM|nr:HEAT repeat domain-containing protein [Aliikangiella marina]TQV71561.1 HEAT repeat domain-containing protein [Aliikangiella marina]